MSYTDPSSSELVTYHRPKGIRHIVGSLEAGSGIVNITFTNVPLAVDDSLAMVYSIEIRTSANVIKTNGFTASYGTTASGVLTIANGTSTFSQNDIIDVIGMFI